MQAARWAGEVRISNGWDSDGRVLQIERSTETSKVQKVVQAVVRAGGKTEEKKKKRKELRVQQFDVIGDGRNKGQE